MTTSYTLTGDFNDLLGEEPRVTGAWLETNLPAGTALVDLDTNKVRLSGPKRITLDASNTFSISLIATNSTGTNVTDGTLRYRVRAQYSDGTGVPRTWESGFFDLTAAADLSDKVGGAGDLDVTIAPSASLIDAPTAANVTGPSQTRTALDAAIAGSALARDSIATADLRAWGHSYVAGVGASAMDTAAGLAPVAADLLGLPLRNEGIGGTSLYSHVGGGAAWPTVLQKITRPRRFSSPGGLHAVMYGINDVNELGNTTAHLEVFRWALRTVVSRLRAGAIFENDHATVVLGGGTWGTNAATDSNSGASYAYCATAGATVTITTPADFPGGTVGLGFTAWSDGGADYTITLNGAAAGSFTTKDANKPAAKRVGRVHRLTGVPAGENTIVVTSAAHTGTVGCVFDYWQWESDESTAPLVVLVKQPKPIDYTGYGAGGVNGPPTDTGVDNLNQIITDVAAEFDGRVVTVDTATMDRSASYFIAGNVHPLAAGHRRLAELIAAALRAVTVTSFVPRGPTAVPRVEYGTAIPTGAGTSWNVGDRVINTAPTKGAPTGWRCTVAGAPGTWEPEAPTGNTGRIYTGTAAPTTGTWAKGDMVINTDAAPPASLGWLCTVAGTPGTWKPLAARVYEGNGEVALVAGTATVDVAPVTTSTRIRLYSVTSGGTVGAHFISARAAGSFTISSTSAADTSTIGWEVLSY